MDQSLVLPKKCYKGAESFMAVKNKSWAESWDDEKGYRGAESLTKEGKKSMY